MKIDHVLSLTHDLSCTFGELGSAARRYALPVLPSSDRLVVGGLAVAAVAFTIQLAIESGRDATEMRALECKLLVALGAV